MKSPDLMQETMQDKEDIVPFVVFGSSKSGTTWLQKLLDAHPEIRCHFQLLAFPMDPDAKREVLLKTRSDSSYRPRSGESPFQGVFQNDIEEKHYRWRHDLLGRMGVLRRHYLTRLFGPISDSEQRAFLQAEHQRIVRAIVRELLVDTPEKRIFGTKAHSDLDHLFELYPQAKVIHIIRDGRDVCVSKRYHNLRMKIYAIGDERSRWLTMLMQFPVTRSLVRRTRRRFGWFGMDWYQQYASGTAPLLPDVLRKIALDWKQTVTYLLDHQRRRPDQVLQVRYEDLKRQSEVELSRILQFLNADLDPACIQLMIDRNRFDKLKQGEQKSFFRKGMSGDWRQHFTPDNVALFKEVAGELLIELGYESDMNWTATPRPTEVLETV